MSKTLVDLALARPGDIIGYHHRGPKKGQPIYLIGGASVDTDTNPTNTPAAQQGFQQGANDAPVYSPTSVSVPASAPQQTPQMGKFFTEEDIQKARQQEKDKLYGDLNKLKSQLDTLTQEREERLKAEQEAREAAEREAEEARRANQDARTFAEEEAARIREEYNRQISELRNSYEQDKIIAQKELEFQKLQSYIQSRAIQEQDNIAPELIDMISGSNEQEVEQSIAILKEKSAAIAQSAQAHFQGQRAGMRGVSVTGYAPVDPIMENNPGYKSYSLEELQAMPVGSPEYRELRQKLGIGRSQSNQGLLG